MSPRPCPAPLRQTLETVADALGDAQISLAGVIEYGGGLDRNVRRTRLTELSRRLRRLADRLDEDETTRNKDREMRSLHVVEELLQVADKAELLTSQIARQEDLPLPIGAGITDRALQLTSLLRLLAAEIERSMSTDKTFNLPISA